MKVILCPQKLQRILVAIFLAIFAYGNMMDLMLKKNLLL
jgi:hypothetical protein